MKIRQRNNNVCKTNDLLKKKIIIIVIQAINSHVLIDCFFYKLILQITYREVFLYCLLFEGPKAIDRFPYCCEPHHESEAKCKAFHMLVLFAYE